MQQLSDISALRAGLAPLRNARRRIALVPTMGNLHAGHLSLVSQARMLADEVVVSIFVNPLQFNNADDLARYPVTLQQDCTLLETQQVSLLFVPQVAEIYPFGIEHGVTVTVPGLSDILCGAHRPGHFTGVATVVNKLLNIVQPDVALFGDKDYQQLLVIRRMVQDLMLPVEIVSGATVREADGLAMSSRNGRLSELERTRAPQLYQILCQLRERWQGGADAATVEGLGMERLDRAGFRPEYCSARAASDLGPVQPGEPAMLLVAAWLGQTRLIDNLLL